MSTQYWWYRMSSRPILQVRRRTRFMRLHSVTPPSPPTLATTTTAAQQLYTDEPSTYLHCTRSRRTTTERVRWTTNAPRRRPSERYGFPLYNVVQCNARNACRAPFYTQVYNVIIPQYYTTVEPVGSRSLLLHHRCSRRHHRRHGRRQGWTKCARGAFGSVGSTRLTAFAGGHRGE